jgi:hypothetical protein
MALPPKPRVVQPVTAMVPIAQNGDLDFLRQPSAHAELLAKYAQEVKETENVPGLKGIKTRAGVLMIDDQQAPDNKLHVIVLAHIRENQYFDPAVPYDEENPRSPICFAQYEGKDISNVFAHELSVVKQNPHEYIDPEDPEQQRIVTLSPCATCHQFAWGSGRGRGKACKEVRKLAVIAWDGLSLENIPVTEPRSLKIPVTSVGGWATYVDALAELNRPPFSVVTEIGTVPDPKTVFRITFKPVAAVPDEFIPYLEPMIEGLKEVLMTPYQPSAQVEEQAPEEEQAQQAVAAKVVPRVVPARR